jgi:hydrogenase 3 maturation protease
MGVGSELRNDDAAGMYLIKKLKKSIKRNDILFIGGGTAPENFTGVIKNFKPDKLIVIDAARMDIPVGEIRLLEAKEIGGLTFSTHMLPLPIMLNYLELEINCRVTCIGIQPKNTEQGFTMCEEVTASVDKLADMFFN